MNYRTFGRTGWQASDLGYAMWEWVPGAAPKTTNRSVRSKQAMDFRCNFCDPASDYGDGRSEKRVDQIVRANSGRKLYSATKVALKNKAWLVRRSSCSAPDRFSRHRSDSKPTA